MALHDSRRLLDGDGDDGTIFGSISAGLNDLADSLETALHGAVIDDVATGAVKPETLNRSQKASLAIDGKVPGFFDGANPWAVGIEFDLTTTAFLAANGGGVLLISCEASAIDTLSSSVLAPRFAFLWDDAVVAQQGTLDLDFTSKTFLIAQLGAPRGTKLTLWTTEPGITFAVIQQGKPGDGDRIRKEVFGAVGAAAGDPLADVKAFFGSILDVQKSAMLLAIVVGGVVVYFLAKGELTALKGGG